MEALSHLSEKKGMKLGLETMRQLQEALGYPDAHFPSIHIAGTNGKGSVATKIARCLQLGGYKVGLYTSPHLESPCERVQINGIPVSDEEADKGLREIFALGFEPTYFEAMTAMALRTFANEQVDVAVIETGLGGRLDATNIITPILSVITSIGLDHCNILGSTREEIAREKGGIIKPGVPVILGPNVPVLKGIVAPSGADYLEENENIARTAFKFLRANFPHIDKNGLTALPPGRFELIDDRILLDVAHNPDGLRALFEAIKQRLPDRPFRILAGFSKGKDTAACLDILCAQNAPLTLVHNDHPRIEKRPGSIHLSEIELDDRLTLICGSCFLMQTAREVGLGIASG